MQFRLLVFILRQHVLSFVLLLFVCRYGESLATTSVICVNRERKTCAQRCSAPISESALQNDFPTVALERHESKFLKMFTSNVTFAHFSTAKVFVPVSNTNPRSHAILLCGG